MPMLLTERLTLESDRKLDKAPDHTEPVIRQQWSGLHDGDGLSYWSKTWNTRLAGPECFPPRRQR